MLEKKYFATFYDNECEQPTGDFFETIEEAEEFCELHRCENPESLGFSICVI